MPTTPPTSTAPPAQLPQRGIKATFNALMDAWVTWLSTKAAVEIPAIAANVKGNADEAFASATTASTAANTATSAAATAVATANATLWVSGQTVAQDANKISPLDRQTYRRKTATGSGTTDPALDTTNYTLISLGQSAYTLLGTATVGSAVANIDFLNIFSDLYTKYIIELTGLTPSASSFLLLQLAAGGTVITNGYSDSASNITFNQPFQVLAAFDGAVTLTVEIRGARQPIPYKSITAEGIVKTESGVRYGAVQGGGISNTSIMSGFRLSNAGGATLTSGTVRVYGVRAA